MRKKTEPGEERLDDTSTIGDETLPLEPEDELTPPPDDEGEMGEGTTGGEGERKPEEFVAPEAVVRQSKPYTPQFAPTALSAEERTKIKSALSDAFTTYDPEIMAETMLGVVEDLSAKRTNAAVRNIMSAQERAASTTEDQIRTIAQNMLFEAAQANPQVYEDEQAVQSAMYAAALRLGYQTKDIAGAMEVVGQMELVRRDGGVGRSGVGRSGGRQEQEAVPQVRARSQETGQFVPVPAGGSVSSVRRGGGEGAGNEQWRQRYPYLTDAQIKVLQGEAA